MGFFRFRRSIKIIPGLRLNVSKTGISTSIGKPGATVNIRGDQVRETVGLPGTGLSYSEQQRTGPGAGGVLFIALIVILIVAWLAT